MRADHIFIKRGALWGLFFVLTLSSCREKEEAGASEIEAQAEWNELEPECFQAVDFGVEGTVAWRDGVLQIDGGESLLGGKWTGVLPKAPYEIELKAKKISGGDFFCGLTVPVRSEEEAVTLIVGGWGGGVTGISSIDEKDASGNETTSYRPYEDDRWYRIRMEVDENHLGAWIDGEQVVDVSLLGKKVNLRPGPIEDCAPLGVATWQTAAEMKEIRWRPIGERE